MKFCPMCGTTQSKVGATVCELCDYEEKPPEMLSSEEFSELMAAYEYERVEDGVRILAVKNIRLRGKVAVPHFVTEIGADAFANCKFITRLDLPKNLRLIGAGAFAHCRDLFDVFIPESVTSMGKGVFANCDDLGVISVEAATQPHTWDSEWLANCCATVEWGSVFS